MTSPQDVEHCRGRGQFDDIRNKLSSRNGGSVQDWLSQGVPLDTPLLKGVNFVRNVTSRGESGLNAIKRAVSGAIESISDLAEEPNPHEFHSSGNRKDLTASTPPSRRQRRSFTGPNGDPLHILTPMCGQPRPTQNRRPSNTSTATSIPEDTTSTSSLTASSRTSIDDTATPSVPISPLSTRCQKIFLPKTFARQQSLREAEDYRKKREAERDERIKARGPAHQERLRLAEDSLNLQHLLLMKLAAVENNKAGLSQNEVPAVSEPELRRQRRELVEALRTSLRFPC